MLEKILTFSKYITNDNFFLTQCNKNCLKAYFLMGKAHLALQHFTEVSWLNFGAVGSSFVLLLVGERERFPAVPQFLFSH